MRLKPQFVSILSFLVEIILIDLAVYLIFIFLLADCFLFVLSYVHFNHKIAFSDCVLDNFERDGGVVSVNEGAF